MARQGFADQADRTGVDRVGRTAVVDAAHGVAQPAGVAERSHQRLALRIDVRAMLVCDVLRGPRIELTREQPMLVVEERPVEVGQPPIGGCLTAEPDRPVALSSSCLLVDMVAAVGTGFGAEFLRLTQQRMGGVVVFHDD